MPLDPGQWVHPNKPGVFWKIASQAVISATILMGKFWIRCANTVHIHNKEVLQDHVDRFRREKKPLLTVSNHTSCLDDFTLCASLKFRSFGLSNPKYMKWTPGASEIAFTTKLLNYYFSLGNIVPVLRGDGVYQRGMDFCLDKLNQRAWVHVYAEGKVNMTTEFLRLKWGVGRLISESNMVPTVLPMWHVGMEEILPNYPPYYPRKNKDITILIGQPMDLRQMVAQMKEEFLSPLEMRKKITDVIQVEMKELRLRAKALHEEHVMR